MYVWNFYSIRHRRQVTRNVIQCVSFYVLEDKNYVIIVVNVSININSPCFPILHSSINQLSSYKTRLTLNYNQPDEVVNETTGCGMLLSGLLCLSWSVSKFGISFILRICIRQLRSYDRAIRKRWKLFYRNYNDNVYFILRS